MLQYVRVSSGWSVEWVMFMVSCILSPKLNSEIPPIKKRRSLTTHADIGDLWGIDRRRGGY